MINDFICGAQSCFEGPCKEDVSCSSCRTPLLQMPWRCDTGLKQDTGSPALALGLSLLIGYQVSLGVVHSCVSAFTEMLIRAMFLLLEVRGHEGG